MEKKPKTSFDIIKKTYVYIFAYFSIAMSLLAFIGTRKVLNPTVLYISGGLFLIIAISCFIKITSFNETKNKKDLVWKSFLRLLLALIIVYIVSKIICISHGGPINFL